MATSDRDYKVTFKAGVNFHPKSTTHSHTQYLRRSPRQAQRVPTATAHTATTTAPNTEPPTDNNTFPASDQRVPTPTPKDPHLPYNDEGFFACHARELQAACKQAMDEEPTPQLPVPKHFALKAVNPDTGQFAEYSTLLKSSAGKLWARGMCNELGRLFQGYKDIKGTNTCRWIKVKDLPTGKKATYLWIVVADRPLKSEPQRVRLTVGRSN